MPRRPRSRSDRCPTELDLTALARPFRYRVVSDPERRPVIPGRLGQIEQHDGQSLAVYTTRPRLFAHLWALPGVQRWQVGDQEVRGLVPSHALPAVARLIRVRRRRPATSTGPLRKLPDPTFRATSAL
jgi:hypothetical protein